MRTHCRAIAQIDNHDSVSQICRYRAASAAKKLQYKWLVGSEGKDDLMIGPKNNSPLNGFPTINTCQKTSKTTSLITIV